MKKYLFLILLSIALFSCGQDRIKSSKGTLLTGNWVSTEDDKYTISIGDSLIIEFYDHEETSRLSYTREDKKLAETSIDDSTTFTYEILKLTEDTLTLIYTERGNILKFTKRTN